MIERSDCQSYKSTISVKNLAKTYGGGGLAAGVNRSNQNAVITDQNDTRRKGGKETAVDSNGESISEITFDEFSTAADDDYNTSQSSFGGSVQSKNYLDDESKEAVASFLNSTTRQDKELVEQKCKENQGKADKKIWNVHEELDTLRKELCKADLQEIDKLKMENEYLVEVNEDLHLKLYKSVGMLEVEEDYSVDLETKVENLEGKIRILEAQQKQRDDTISRLSSRPAAVASSRKSLSKDKTNTQPSMGGDKRGTSLHLRGMLIRQDRFILNKSAAFRSNEQKKETTKSVTRAKVKEGKRQSSPGRKPKDSVLNNTSDKKDLCSNTLPKRGLVRRASELYMKEAKGESKPTLAPAKSTKDEEPESDKKVKKEFDYEGEGFIGDLASLISGGEADDEASARDDESKTGPARTVVPTRGIVKRRSSFLNAITTDGIASRSNTSKKSKDKSKSSKQRHDHQYTGSSSRNSTGSKNQSKKKRSSGNVSVDQGSSTVKCSQDHSEAAISSSGGSKKSDEVMKKRLAIEKMLNKNKIGSSIRASKVRATAA